MSKRKYSPPDSTLSVIVVGAFIAVGGAAILSKSPGMLVIGLIAVCVAVRMFYK